MQRLIRCLLASATLLLLSRPALAADYSVSYNPYGSVDWGTTLRCQSQHHDHAYLPDRIVALDAAGYCAVTFMNYSGKYRPSSQAELDALGNPNPDPGQPVGWGPPRRWPPTSYGAPALPLTNLKLYLPGAEEDGLYVNGSGGKHVQSMFLTTYIEGSGCPTCGIGGIPVATNVNGLPASQIHSNSQELIDRVVENGGHATLNHPGGAPYTYQGYNRFGSVEMYNNFWRNVDDLAGNNTFSNQFMAVWDYLLQHKSARIWGVAGNDWFSAWTDLGQTYEPASFYPAVTEQNRDRGKLQVLLSAYDLDSYRTAFEAGAFFAIVENNAIKAAYPTVSNIAVAPASIAIATVAGTEAVEWIGNGVVVGSGPSLSLSDLPAGLVYVRAEIDDDQGRTVYSQPFSLGPRLPDPPPPPGPAVPSLPVRALALLALILLVAVASQAGRSARLD